MTQNISRDHSNRKAHNWLAYAIGDRFRQRHAHLCTGVLYDLGCGESPYRAFLSQGAQRYVGVDWSNTLHATKPDIVADLNHPLPVPSDTADTAVSFSVIEHLSEPQTMLGEACRILKPGGVLILQVPWQWQVHEAPYDFFRYSPFGLRHLLTKAGFTDIIIEPMSGCFTTLTLKMSYFTRRFVRGPRPVRWLVQTILWPAWFLSQCAAPLLDRLDRNWQAEAHAYFVTARKPRVAGPGAA